MSFSTTPSQTADDGATVAVRLCPKCQAPNAPSALSKNAYRCESCSFELAYLDRSTTGVVRNILGWVRSEGEIIDQRYRITQLLGRGGFGCTYLVEDLELDNKRRAVKEIPNGVFNDAEAALLARLDHPAIPDIVDRLFTENMTYLVLRFGGTRTLGSEKKRLGGRVPLARLTPWIHQLCRALAYLHGQKPPIIHRDLKPDNILLDEQDNVMLIDFGIAKLANPEEATQTIGRAVSYGFSSPEQITGRGTDQRSDIYSLAATVYYLATGVYPPDIHEQISGKRPEPISKFVPDTPDFLDKAILKALSLNAEERQQSIHELLTVFEDLDRTMPRMTIRVGSEASPSRRNAMIVGGLLLTALAAAGTLYWLLSGALSPVLEPVPDTSPEVAAAPVTPPPVTADPVPQPPVQEPLPEPPPVQNTAVTPVQPPVQPEPVAVPTGTKRPSIDGSFFSLIGPAQARSADGDLALGVDKPQFRIGETVTVRFVSSRPAHIYLVYVNSAGEAAQIYPYKNQPDTLHEMNKMYVFPPKTNTKLKLRVAKPVGRDKLVIMASDAVIDDADVKARIGRLDGGGSNDFSMAELPIDIVP